MLKKLTSIILIVLMCCSTVAFAANEYDYKSMLQTLDAIDWNSEFPMDSLLTRAQFSKMAIMISPYRDSVATNLSISPFIDVTHKYWGAPYIHTAVSSGIINGYIDGTFRPEDPINYEEAITICLKILGYTNDDFGSSWPYGQIGIAKKIGLTDNLTSSVGVNIHRADAINLLYNTLCATPKNSSSVYVETLGYKLTDSVTIIATHNQDSSVPSDSVSTSTGTYKIDSSFDYKNVGMKGTIVTEGKDFVLFFPDNEKRTHDSYAVYSTLANDVLIYKNGNIENLGASMDTTVYLNGQQTTLKNVISSLEVGYGLSLSKKADGSVDYITVESNSLDGPFIANTSVINSYRSVKNIIRDGKKSSADELMNNDVLYHSKALETVWAYSKKVTGIYESASPNKDTPKSIIVSGKTYALEGAAAYGALSSSGTFDYGDTITLLLGRNGDVAGVMSSTHSSSVKQVAGYLVDAGQKQFTDSNGNEYTSLFVSIVQTDGNIYEYTTTSNYKSMINSVVTVSFSGGKASLREVSKASGVSGKVNYADRTLGNHKFANDIEILDISTTAENEPSLYTPVFVQRLDGTMISSTDVLYYEKNPSGEIQQLILKNATGDMYTYGLVTKAEVSRGGTSASYTYIADGTTSSMTSSSVFSVLSGQPAKFIGSGGRVQSIIPLTPVSATASEVSYTSLKAGGISYPLSDKVVIYEKRIATTYTYLDTPISDLIEKQKDYTIRAYVDKEPSHGGRVRIILIEKK